MNLRLQHFTALSDIANSVYHLHNLASFAQNYIKLDGNLIDMSGAYSFQADILNDTSRVNNTVKPAQIGLTTSTIAYFLSGLATQSRFNTIYALPTAGDASKLTTTKVNPLIYESPRLNSILNKEVNSVELKQLGKNFLFTRGCRSETAALSISADVLVADEVDRCDPDVLKQFRSRLQNSPLKIIRQFSTPTVPGVGITREATTSKRYRHMGCCSSCGHKWLPTYDLDMVVPDWDRPLEEIDRFNLKDIRWQEAHWRCPRCGRDPQFQPELLEWVVENPNDNYEAHTYFITPVTACQILVPSYIVRTSTEFNTRAEWRNQVLGEPAEDKDSQVTHEDLEKARQNLDFSDSDAVHYLGVDIGQLCHFVVSRLHQGTLLVVHREVAPLSDFHAVRNRLIRNFRCIVSVHDAMPETALITSVTDFDPNAYGCIFTTSKSTEIYTVAEKEADPEAGRLNLRLVKVRKAVAFDTLMDLIKKQKFIFKSQKDDSKFILHILSMKRTMVFQNDEPAYVWQKTDGEDHYMHALLYSYIACTLRMTASETVKSGTIELVRSFRVRNRY